MTNEEILGAVICYVVISWTFCGLWALFSQDNYSGIPYRLAKGAPTKEAKLATYVLFTFFGPLTVVGVFGYVLYLIARFFGIFFRGVRDLIPKRKPKVTVPEARVHHG
jgi:hypothetical protein